MTKSVTQTYFNRDVLSDGRFLKICSTRLIRTSAMTIPPLTIRDIPRDSNRVLLYSASNTNDTTAIGNP